MNTSYRLPALVLLLAMFFLFHSNSLARGNNKGKYKVAVGKTDPNEIQFLKEQTSVRKEADAAELIGNLYIAASEPNDFVVDMDGQTGLQVIDPNEVLFTPETANVGRKKMKKDDLLRYAQHQAKTGPGTVWLALFLMVLLKSIALLHSLMMMEMRS